MNVTINTTPTQQIIAAAVREAEVIDGAGRAIKLRKPGVLAQFRLVEAVGDAAKNAVYMGMCMPLLFVASIDGEDVEPIARKSELEALINRLGEEGVAAIMAKVDEVFGASDPEADKAALKKSQQPPQ
ncbi:hypothetical protein DEH84_07040 [Aquabacterium olei]|uniref:Uncharacterized protein n=1 Tax=Aquabacterium olei TaxID=1296669 RepID=A0A2U8FQ73_9BURK|nr:hypothetical protein [Aquabacterium olei]AWI53212.1 hypothetical protein DEH84_07040 [Aquabacterium olei]